MPDQIQEVGGVLAVMNGESGIKPDLLGVLAQQPCADAVKSACPGQRVRHHPGFVTQDFTCDPLDPRRHLGSRAARSEEHTSELQSHLNLVCRLLLEKKKKHIT